MQSEGLQGVIQMLLSGGDDEIVALGQRLEKLESALRQPPIVAFVGEFSAGKSSLINALLSSSLLPTHILSSTRAPTLLRYAHEPIAWLVTDSGRERVPWGDIGKPHANARWIDIGLPEPILGKVRILDTPGFSDPSIGQYDATQRAIEGANFCVWCTLATQAWRESERVLWEGVPLHLRHWSVLAVTQADLLANSRDRRRVVARVRKHTEDLFGRTMLLSINEAQANPRKGGLDKFRATLIQHAYATQPQRQQVLLRRAKAILQDALDAAGGTEVPTEEIRTSWQRTHTLMESAVATHPLEQARAEIVRLAGHYADEWLEPLAAQGALARLLRFDEALLESVAASREMLFSVVHQLDSEMLSLARHAASSGGHFGLLRRLLKQLDLDATDSDL